MKNNHIVAQHQTRIDNLRVLLQRCPDIRRRDLIKQLGNIELDVTKVRGCNQLGARIENVARRVTVRDGVITIA